ncbi:MAG: PspA/IM30 family protein [Gammaproteobacteria bacterium]
MASINLFGRLTNLWTGFLSLWIQDVEKNHPEIAYENTINSLTEKYAKLKHTTAAIIRRRDDIRRRVEAENEALARIKKDLEAALSTSQDDLAMICIQKQEALESSLQDLSAEGERAESDAEDAKAALLNVKSEIQKLRDEKDRMLAKMQSAQARIKIQDQLEGLSVEADVQALNAVRSHIKDTIAEANLGKEVRESDLDERLQRLRKQSGSISAKAKLDELKRAREASAQEASSKTM